MKKILALVLVALLVLAGSAMAEAKAGEGLLIGVVYKQSGNAYFQASVEGIQKAADELGFEFMHDGPDDGSNDGAIRIIENYIAQGVDALVISANDPMLWLTFAPRLWKKASRSFPTTQKLLSPAATWMFSPPLLRTSV